MKFTIDTDVIKKLGIPKEVFFHVLYLYFCTKGDCEIPKIANEMGLNIKDTGGYMINKGGTQLIESVFMHSERPILRKDTDYEALALKLQKLFPDGRKAGTHKIWSGSTEEVTNKLRLLEYQAQCSINEDKAVEATLEYVKSFEDKQFMQTLPNFIFRARLDDSGIADWSSNLLSIMENVSSTHYKE